MTTPTGQGPMNRTGSKVPSGYKQFQIQKYGPEAMKLYQDMMQNVSPDSYLGKLAAGDQSTFEEMEAPAMRQFSSLQGNMASRFSGMGTGGRKSSGFQNTMSQAGSDFAQDLQAKRMQTRMDAIRDLMGYSNQLLGQDPYETGLVQKQQKPNYWAEAAGKLAGAIPKAAVSYFTGNPAMAADAVNDAFSGGQTRQSGNPQGFGV